MKKLSSLFILIFLTGILFASPKIPIWGATEDEPLIYLSNDCNNYYSIGVFTLDYKKYKFSFIKYSLSNDALIAININCNSEKDVNSLIANIDTTNLDNEFINLRKKIIKLNISPDIFYQSDIPNKVIYNMNYSNQLN